MAITANKKFWTEFIDIYHSLPSLWNTKDENYNNRDSRSMAWNKLVEKLQEVEPDANQDSVKRKINTFRSNFNREVRKIRHTQKEQPTEVYNPTLWYFEHFSFLLNQEKFNSNGVVSIDGHYDEEMTLMGLTTAKSEIMEETETMQVESVNQAEMTKTDNSQNSQYENLNSKSITRLEVESNNLDKLAGPEVKPLIENTSAMETLPTESNHLDDESIEEPQNSTGQNNHLNLDKAIELSSMPERRTLRSNLNKRSKTLFKSQDTYHKAVVKNNLLLTDEAAIYGQSWACGFRKLSPQQKLFAKKAIDEILILGQLKALKFMTVPMNANLLDKAGDET